MAKIEFNTLLTVETELSELDSIVQAKVSGGESPIIASSTVSSTRTNSTLTSITTIDENGNSNTVNRGFRSIKRFEKVTSQPIDDDTTPLFQQISF